MNRCRITMRSTKRVGPALARYAAYHADADTRPGTGLGRQVWPGTAAVLRQQFERVCPAEPQVGVSADQILDALPVGYAEIGHLQLAVDDGGV
jgi:hypothetical protein